MVQPHPDDTGDAILRGPAEDEDDLELELEADPAALGRAKEILGIIPEEAFRADPEHFARYVESVFLEGEDLDEAVERHLSPSGEPGSGRRPSVRAVVPREMLSTTSLTPAALLEQIFLAFDEIERVVEEALKRRAGAARQDSRPGRLVVPARLIADPVELTRAIDALQSEAEKLELLIRQARNALHRLEPYRLSRQSSGKLIDQIRHGNELRTLQYLVEFLWSIRVAADSLEELDLPHMHIRDYLTYLYQMGDWDAMSTLVRRLRHAVLAYTRDHAG